MRELSFTLDSVAQPEYESLMQGYQGIAQVPPVPPSFFERVKQISKRAALFIASVRGRPAVVDKDPDALDLTLHPILDPEFLEFCITIAQALRAGAVVGSGDGEKFFYPNRITLSEKVQGRITIFCGGDRLMVPIAPHSYAVAVSDVPVYARLCELRRLTKDHSTSELLNRLALWLSHFVYTAHFGRQIVASYPGRDTKQTLNKEFFAKISSRMFS